MVCLLAEVSADLTAGAALLAGATYVARTSWEMLSRARPRGENGGGRPLCGEHSGLVSSLGALEKRFDRIEVKLDELLSRH